MTTVTIALRLSGADRVLLARVVAALERGVGVLELTIPRPRTLHLSKGAEQPRNPGEAPVPSKVHRGNQLGYDINSTDAITRQAADLAGITFTGTVEPPDAGLLTTPDADGKFVFLPDEAGVTSTCAIEMRAEFADGSQPQILTDSVTIDPDGRVLGMGQGVEQPRDQPAPAA